LLAGALDSDASIENWSPPPRESHGNALTVAAVDDAVRRSGLAEVV